MVSFLNYASESKKRREINVMGMDGERKVGSKRTFKLSNLGEREERNKSMKTSGIENGRIQKI